MDILQLLCQAAAGHRCETMVTGVLLQLTDVLEGTALLDMNKTAGWDTLVAEFLEVVNTFKSAFVPQNSCPSNNSAPSAPLPRLGRPPLSRLESNHEQANPVLRVREHLNKPVDSVAH